MRVYFINSFLEGCYNVRCLFPLQSNGWDGDRTTFLSNKVIPENKAKAVLNSDIIVFHRPDKEKDIETMHILKKQGKICVMDNDDTVKDDGGLKFNDYMDKERVERGMITLNKQMDRFIKEADLVTCSTEFLAEEYRKINPNVVVLPNCIDPFYFPEPLRNEDDTIRIGITGSLGITSDMELVKPIIEHYKNDKRIKFVLFSMPPNKDDTIIRSLYSEEYKFWESVDVEWQPFVPAEEYYETLNNLKLDIAIIPRADNYFNRCKSNLKFLEDSMLEIPCVCQSFKTGDSPYQVNPEDSKHMILADGLEEFIAAIEKLIASKELRLEMGAKAREYVENKYDITKNSHKWVTAYKSLTN